MAGIWFIFRSGDYPIIHVFLSISDQPCCKIKFVYFWVRLNVIPPFVVFTNLSWSPIFQDIITNHVYGWIVVLRHFLKPDFIGTGIESWRYMLLSLLPSEWIWHYVFLIWPCTGFSMIFRMKYFMRLRWYFLNTW